MSIIRQAQLAKQASIGLAILPTKIKNNALAEISKSIRENSKLIIDDNKKDIDAAKKLNLNPALIKRLVIDENKINEIIEEIISVENLMTQSGKIYPLLNWTKI